MCVYIYAPCWAKVKQLFMRCREPCCSLRSVHMACSNETGSGSGPSCTFQIRMLFQATFTQHLPTATVPRGKQPLEATLRGFTNPCVLCKEHPHHLPSAQAQPFVDKPHLLKTLAFAPGCERCCAMFESQQREAKCSSLDKLKVVRGETPRFMRARLGLPISRALW